MVCGIPTSARKCQHGACGRCRGQDAEVAFDEANGEVYSGQVQHRGVAFLPENDCVALAAVSVRVRFQESNRLRENAPVINDTNLFCGQLNIRKRE